MRLIDADALIEDVRKHSESYFADDFAHYWVNKQPTIESERKTGRWIPCPQNASWLYVYKCSECGGYLQISDVDGKGYKAKYCSYCGAKMEGGEADG